jgi:hypothetical protein
VYKEVDLAVSGTIGRGVTGETARVLRMVARRRRLRDFGILPGCISSGGPHLKMKQGQIGVHEKATTPPGEKEIRNFLKRRDQHLKSQQEELTRATI